MITVPVTEKRKDISLKVLDPDPSHVGRNIITLDQETKTALEVTSGDIVEIEGTKKTAAVIWPARAEDEGKQIIRMDNLIRHNAGVGLGEKVIVRKADPKEAKKVVLAPTQEVRIIASGYDRILKKNFIGRPLTRGDNVWISVFGSGFVYTVVETNPHGIIKVNDSTQFVLKEQPVKEALEGVPKVAYEDIGGLEDQVQKVREMIELPMRHPELFRRLGIQPPKGVLLHGPPGCGKTLLAKAVANETNAHFISVAAPALMCVGGETRILTNPAGEKIAVELFEEGTKNGNLINDGALKIVELQKPIKVFGVNKDLKIEKGEITHITKLKAKTIRVNTNLGEEIVVSSNQPFAVLDAFGNIAWKTAGELKQGDLVAAARLLPESTPESLDVFKLCKADLQVNTKSGTKKFSEAVLARDLIQLPDSRNNPKNRVFVKIPLQPSEELMHLLGLMYSEGYLSKDGVVFTNYDAVLLQEFSELCEKVFGIPAVKKKTKAICYSTTARLFLEKVLGFPVGKKGDYSLPEWYFKISKEQAARFLQGFWEGDGTVGKGIGDYPTIRFYAKGKKILADLSVLSKKLGWVCRLAPWKTHYCLMNALVLQGNRSRELFAEQIVSSAAKFERISKWYEKRVKKGNDLCFPDISPLLKKIKNEKKLVYGKTLPEAPTERYISGRDPLTHRKLEEINELFGKPVLLDCLAKADLSWSRITLIESEGEKELFDFTVEPFNNFLAGHSLLVLHNSKFVGEAEERIRQVFKEAEENAPSIIFFDEIDAIAPKRDEVIGEVERRVVAQLLASMDGMEARGNTIVIAATNRVNSIDEALRRPGRFDREIEFPVPDKNGRKEVLQIHSRGMPLAKDVDLDYYAGISHGFVGADIAALAKEAAMKALRRYLPKINLEEETIPPEVLEDLEVNKNDFDDALKDVQPSALREVTIEVPNVKWVDIGALESAKQELKQAVEWPLKYPDSFRNLGIRPPRGILLYGPPGCGKTLLAKAVATESEANFISVKGPELISMWVGESLPFDEELLVFDGKKIFREKIGKIVEQKQNLQVVTFDNDGKIFFSRISDFIKHPLNGKMLEITTKTGRKIRVTDKHSLFSLVENEIEPVVPSQLVEGKSVVAIPAKIPNVSFGEKHLNLLELFALRNDFFISSKQTKELIKKIGYKKANELTGLKKKYLYDIVQKELSLNLKNFSLLLETAKEKAVLDNAKIFRKGARNSLLALLPLSEDLFELIGLWVAEGDINNGVPRISVLDEEIMRETKGILGRLCLNYSVFEGRGIVINSTTLTSVFGELGLETGSFNKKIPNNLLVAPNNLVFAFLRGYFSGDGTIRDNGHSCMIEATTVSEQLANDLLYLLLKLGIVANYAQKKEWTGSISHRIQLFGAENFKRFAPAGFIDKKRNLMIQEYINKVSWTRSNVIPVNQKIESLLTEAFVSYPQNQTVGKGKLKQVLCMVDLQKQKYPDLWKIVEADIFWDTVKKIKEIPYNGFVFDISVEPCQNFVAGFGGLFAHNSERGIRKIFKKARQVSPVIVFFDEIDSIASHRGSAMDSGVGDRMVNQLLTELDGIEALKDVVFIAATNRPDLIDPGLLRPGRIDKLIKINAPDEKARLAIFKVHVKKVPLAKDISLEELAKKTDGFSGADIEGLIREAALIALSQSNMKAKIVEKKHLDAALQKALPSITKETEEAYDEFREKIGKFKPSYIE